MRVLPYSSEHFPQLEAAVRAAGAAQSLRRRDFVEWYYGTREWCRLFLAFTKDGVLAAAIGIEQLPFEIGGEPLLVGGASNFVSFQPGAGGVLFLHWLRSSDAALVFGGSPDTHRILESQRQRWTYFAGVRTYTLNGRFAPRRGRHGWRAAAASVLRAVAPYVHPARRLERLLADRVVAPVRVAERSDFDVTLVPPSPGPFALRLAPSLDYLRWRYDPTLPFVRYRCFRIADETDRSRGYVVLNDQDAQLVVAQADADDPRVLAAGILAAVAEVASAGDPRRTVMLASAHGEMQTIFTAAGFVPAASDRAFALGSGRKKIAVAPETSRWLVNYDWLDNGLRF